MKAMLNKWVYFILFLCFTSSVCAQLSTPSVISSDMVLQQGQKVPIWGTATPNERIKVTFAGQSISTRADAEGHWEVELQPMKADKTPRQMVIKGKKTNIVYDNILVGEVWLCSGQSNMQYTMKLIPPFAPPAKGQDLAALELQKPANPMIRVFMSDHKHSWHSWRVADGKSLANVSAAGYFFGKNIQEKLDVPVGIISVAVGGTRIETWTSKEAYRNSPVFSPQLEASGRIDGLSPGERYEKLIVPFLPFAVKGFLWYQGENNCGMGDRAYVEKYKILVNSWRKAFRNENAPFYSVLLAPHIYSDRIHRNTSRPVTAEELPLFRDQQLKTLSVVSNTDIITISDLVDDLRDIHPSYKWEVGARLARVALAKDYGHTEIVWSGPRAKEATLIADSIVLSFDHVAAGLKTNNKKRLEWFEIAGSDGVFHPAVADIKDKDKVVVYHPEIKRPVKVRFGWHETAIPNLVNSEGLPTVPFLIDRNEIK